MKQVLSTLVIHDMKNSLALLEMDLERLNHRKNVPMEAKDAYLRCLELKSRLINFLTVYKSEQFELEPCMVEVDITDFLEELVDTGPSKIQAQKRHITLCLTEAKISSEVKYAGIGHFDAYLIGLALESALNNAVRFARHAVNIWFEQSQHSLNFLVSDDGHGIGTETQGADSPSTGLGLELCRAVAKCHHGQISLVNAHGGGALFNMKLAQRSYSRLRPPRCALPACERDPS